MFWPDGDPDFCTNNSIKKEKMKKADVCIRLYSNFPAPAVTPLIPSWFEVEGPGCHHQSPDFF